MRRTPAILAALNTRTSIQVCADDIARLDPPRKLGQDFFQQDATSLGRALIGKVLCRRSGRFVMRGRIVETEAYLGPRDLASHSSKGRTARTEVMFGPVGRAYVYLIYGMHWMFNVVCGQQGAAHAVLIRGATPMDGWTANLSGPGRLARAFGFERRHNGVVIGGGELWIECDGLSPRRIARTPRIGIDYAGHWKGRLLRFVDGDGSPGTSADNKGKQFHVCGRDLTK